jgi:hypothetical protein
MCSLPAGPSKASRGQIEASGVAMHMLTDPVSA